jgi:hypothetical protein
MAALRRFRLGREICKINGVKLQLGKSRMRPSAPNTERPVTGATIYVGRGWL